MTTYYFGISNITVTLEAEDDNGAIEVAKTLVNGTDYTGFQLLNNETGRFFDLFGQTL